MGNNQPKPFEGGRVTLKVNCAPNQISSNGQLFKFKPGDVITGYAGIDLQQPYKSYKLTVGIFECVLVHFYYDRGSDRNKTAFKRHITTVHKIELADFTAEQFEPPLNLEPIPGGY